jgi:hypothetical protein
MHYPCRKRKREELQDKKRHITTPVATTPAVPHVYLEGAATPYFTAEEVVGGFE